jgi:hypothetical protein
MTEMVAHLYRVRLCIVNVWTPNLTDIRHDPLKLLNTVDDRQAVCKRITNEYCLNRMMRNHEYITTGKET